jgi:hypothetical protein
MFEGIRCVYLTSPNQATTGGECGDASMPRPVGYLSGSLEGRQPYACP